MSLHSFRFDIFSQTHTQKKPEALRNETRFPRLSVCLSAAKTFRRPSCQPEPHSAVTALQIMRLVN